MVLKKKTDFNWKCPHCGKRSLVRYDFQFQVPQTYSADCECSKCGKTSVMRFALSVDKKYAVDSKNQA